MQYNPCKNSVSGSFSVHVRYISARKRVVRGLIFLQVNYPERTVTPEQIAHMTKTVGTRDTRKISSLFASVKSIPMPK